MIYMKLSQKYTCNNCKALDWFTHRHSACCSLGFKINNKFVPLEPCYKPKTYKELCEVRIIQSNK